MAVQFKMVPKQNNLASPPEIKFYPCAVSRGEVNLDDLAKIISDTSSMSKADCYGVIIALSNAIGKSLADGNLVKIDPLGTFSLRLQGTAADSPEPLGKNTIKGANINYKPSRELQKRMEQVTYKRIR
jgi:predicted histone-like DNA-binding protein